MQKRNAVAIRRGPTRKAALKMNQPHKTDDPFEFIMACRPEFILVPIVSSDNPTWLYPTNGSESYFPVVYAFLEDFLPLLFLPFADSFLDSSSRFFFLRSSSSSSSGCMKMRSKTRFPIGLYWTIPIKLPVMK